MIGDREGVNKALADAQRDAQRATMQRWSIEQVFYMLSGLLHEHQVDISDIHFIIQVDSPRNALAIEGMFYEWKQKNQARVDPRWVWPNAFEMYGIKIEFKLNWRPTPDPVNRIL